MKNVGLSDRIRLVAQEKYVVPAVQAGQTQVEIRVRSVQDDLLSDGFSGNPTPQICSALKTAKFLRENHLEIESIDGPPSKQSPTVVFHYRLTEAGRESTKSGGPGGPAPTQQTEPSVGETPEAKAHRLAGRLRGLLKEELAQFGGGEAFLRWVRGNDEEDAE